MSRWSSGTFLPTARNRCTSTGAGSRVSSKFAQPPEAQPLGHHRVQAAQRAVLDRPPVLGVGPEGEPRRALVARGPAHRHRDPFEPVGQRPSSARIFSAERSGSASGASPAMT